MRRRSLAAALVLSLALTGWCAAGASAAASPAGSRGALLRVAIVFLPGLDWPELREGLAAGELPNLARLAAEGGIGLMNALTGARPGPADAYVTLGAGARAAGGTAAGEAFDRREEVLGAAGETLYRVRAGRPAPEGEVVHAGLPAILAASAELPYRVPVGGLGEALRRGGVPAAVFGNADVPAPAPGRGAPPIPGEGAGRWAAAALMDARGTLGGHVGRDLLAFDPNFPGGWRTDDDRLSAEAAARLGRGGVVAVETGDLLRIEAQAERMAPGAYARARRQALRRADRLVGVLAARLDPARDRLFVLSPFPSEAARQAGAVLTPILAWGRGIDSGLLTSGTTRHPGVVADIDFAPTVLAGFGLPVPAEMFGRPMTVAPAGEIASVTAVDRLHARTLANHLRRPPLVQAYVTLQIAVLLAALGVFGLRRGSRRAVRAALVALTCVPLAYLLLGLWSAPPVWLSCLLVAALTALLAAVVLPAGRRGDPVLPFAAASGLTVLAVAADALAGGRLMENSPLGHSLIGGTRYYGVGNEFMGVLLGASLIAGTALLDAARPGPGGRGPGAAVGAAWAGVLLLLASPRFGANFGGTLAVAVAYAIVLFRLRSPRLSARHLLAAGAAAFLLAALAAWADSAREVAVQTHAGRAVASLRAGDWGSLGDLVLRKGEMNWKLVRWTRWSYLFLVSLGIYAWLSLRPPRRLAAALRGRRRLAAGFSGAAVGSLAALAFNDSGVVAAATAMIFASAPLVALLLEDPPAVPRRFSMGR